MDAAAAVAGGLHVTVCPACQWAGPAAPAEAVSSRPLAQPNVKRCYTCPLTTTGRAPGAAERDAHGPETCKCFGARGRGFDARERGERGGLELQVPESRGLVLCRADSWAELSQAPACGEPWHLRQQCPRVPRRSSEFSVSLASAENSARAELRPLPPRPRVAHDVALRRRGLPHHGVVDVQGRVLAEAEGRGGGGGERAPQNPRDTASANFVHAGTRSKVPDSDSIRNPQKREKEGEVLRCPMALCPVMLCALSLAIAGPELRTDLGPATICDARWLCPLSAIRHCEA